MRLPFAQVDAFATRMFEGNPAAVVLLDDWLDDATLQAMAAENNLSETAFVLPAAADGTHPLRWFSPTTEVALCGHATLAAGHVLLTRTTREEVRFSTRDAGTLAVARAGGGYAIDLPALPAAPRPLPEVVAAMGGVPVETQWHEHRYALLVYRSEAEVRDLRPDFRALAALGNILFVAAAPGSEADAASRAFAPGAGVDEDPATGSAHCLLAPYWAARLGREAFSAVQLSARGARIKCRLAGERVVLEGGCVTVIEGEYHL